MEVAIAPRRACLLTPTRPKNNLHFASCEIIFHPVRDGLNAATHRHDRLHPQNLSNLLALVSSRPPVSWICIHPQYSSILPWCGPQSIRSHA